MDEDARKRFLAMRYKADMRAHAAEEKLKFQRFKEMAAAAAQRHAKEQRVGRALAEAVTQNIGDSIELKAKLIPENQVRNRPAEKLVTGKVKGKKRWVGVGPSI